jgi:hypothetical protein
LSPEYLTFGCCILCGIATILIIPDDGRSAIPQRLSTTGRGWDKNTNSCVDEMLPDLQIRLVLAQAAPEARGYYARFLRRGATMVGPRHVGALLALAASTSGARKGAVTIAPSFTSLHRKQLLLLAADTLAVALRLPKAAQPLFPPSVFEEEQESNVH